MPLLLLLVEWAAANLQVADQICLAFVALVEPAELVCLYVLVLLTVNFERWPASVAAEAVFSSACHHQLHRSVFSNCYVLVELRVVFSLEHYLLAPVLAAVEPFSSKQPQQMWYFHHLSIPN